MDWMVGSDASLDDATEEMDRPRTESERVKMKETMRVYVGEARKSSWSCGDRIRRVGCVNFMSFSDGGEGNGGVFGAGVDDCACFWGVRLRGPLPVSLSGGSFWERSGMEEGRGGGGAVAEGIVGD